MMKNKYQIYEKNESREPEPLRLRLVDAGSHVAVQVVDRDGYYQARGNLVEFDQDTGKIHRCVNIRSSLGLPLDSRNRVLLEDE